MKAKYIAVAASILALSAANAGIIILDDFSSPSGGLAFTSPGSAGPLTDNNVWPSGANRTMFFSSTPLSSGIGNTVSASSGLVVTTGTGTDGLLSIKYTNPVNPPIVDSNLDLGLVVRGIEHDLALTLTYTIFTTTGDWTYTQSWPSVGVMTPEPDIVLNNADLAVAWGAPDWSGLTGFEFLFDPAQAGDFGVSELGIPEPSQYAMVAGLGLAGLVAWRRIKK